MRGTRVKIIKKDVKAMIAEHPEMWAKYSFHDLYKQAKKAWKRWHK